LLARLGRLLTRHGHEGVVVMSTEEFEQARCAAYAAGWQDAVEEYGPRIAAARWEGWLGRWRPLRVVDGSAEVVDFKGGDRSNDADGAAEGGPDRRNRVRGGASGAGPTLSPKNRRSKSPTIPRLPAAGRRRPGWIADAPDDAQE
jgi:hypothetical protein